MKSDARASVHQLSARTRRRRRRQRLQYSHVIGASSLALALLTFSNALRLVPIPASRSGVPITSKPGHIAPSAVLPIGSTVALTEPNTGCRVILLGCFHGSPSSAADVTDCVLASAAAGQNITIVLELCASRFADLRRDIETDDAVTEDVRPQRPQRPSWLSRYSHMVTSTIRTRGWGTGVVTAVLGGLSGLQATWSNLEPGLEFTTALRLARQHHHDIVLADTPVEETLHNMGQLGTISLTMWQQVLQTRNVSVWQRESDALHNALFGNGANDSVTLGSFMTRSAAARFDVVRVVIPPLLSLQAAGLLLQQHNNIDSIEPAVLASTNVVGHDLWNAAVRLASVDLATNLDMSFPWIVANLALLALGYVTVALPATKVILRERDDVLAAGIRAACELHASKNDDAPTVVAVLGLLHVNGVAERLRHVVIGQHSTPAPENQLGQK